MSEHESRDSGDEILDGNLERLLSQTTSHPRVPDEARKRMLAQIQQRQGGNEPGGRVEIFRIAKSRRTQVATAVVALAAAIVLAWVLGLGERILGGRESPRLATFQHDGLGARAIELSDGSTALLRAGTRLEQLGPRRLRLVAGEVLLDVREAADPFWIETSHGRAMVLGTRVLLRSDDAQTLAAVLRGSATVESSQQGNGSASTLLLRAGEQALLVAEAAPARIAGRRLSFEVDWARELLAPEAEIEPMRRGNLLARVPRWTGQLQRSAEWPLPMRDLIVDVHVEDGQVRTTIDQTFFNHLERDLEGIYQFPLPPEAAIARLAMYVDGQRMEAGVVARDRGRDIYEQIVHRRRDPALLEWMQGNLFQVRIFPLPGRTEKRVLLSYTAALDELYGRGELRVPIPAIDLPVGKVSYRVRVVGAAGREFISRNQEFELRDDGQDLVAEFSADNHVIGADIVATLSSSAPGLAPPSVEHHRLPHDDGRRHVSLRLRPDLQTELDALSEAATSAPARDIVVLFDSSASRGPAELDAQRRFVDALLEHLDAGDRVAVLRFDTNLSWATPSLEPLATLDRSALATELARAKIGVGATDLGAAVDAALLRLSDTPAPSDDARERMPMLVYLGDGLAQELSSSAPDGSGDWVDRLAARMHGHATFVGVSFGPAYDQPALARLAAAGDGLHLHVGEGEPVSWRALELLTTLSTTRVLDLEASLVAASGQVIASNRTHASARSLADGETFELLAELSTDDPDPVAVQLSGRAAGQRWTKRIELPQPADGARWIPRNWARAHVAALTDAGVEANAEEITKLGLEHFLVTPTTSLLVLESEQMYRDFAVHRPPADAWASYKAPDRIEVVREGSNTVAGHGQYVVRTPVQMVVDYSNNWGITRGPMVPLASAEPIGIGGLGLRGTGRGGGGFGFGVGGESIGLGSDGVIGFGGRGKSLDVADDRRTTDAAKAATTEFRGFVSRNSGPMQWQANKQQSVAPTPGIAHFESRFSGAVIFGEKSAKKSGGYANSQPWPQARHYAWDRRLDDLGELVPALFEEPFDLAREQLLLTGLDGSRGSVSDAAAQLIEAARAAQGDVRYELPEGGTLDIDAQGHFAIATERWGFLDEAVSYDGEQLRADYLELGLSVVRAVGATSPALFGDWVPWLVPPADHLAHFYVVERSGPLTLTLTPITDEGEADQRLEVELDASHRVVMLRLYAGEQHISATKFHHTDKALTLLVDGYERTLVRVGRAQPFAAPLQATRVELPLPSPAELGIALEKHTPGDPAWIALQQQRLAGYAALGSTVEQLAVLDALREHTGRILPGELALAGAALHQAPTQQRDAILDAGEGPLFEYVRAGIAGPSAASALAKLASREDLHRTPVGFLASYRTLLREAERNPTDASLRRLESFLQDYRHPTHAYVATMQISNRWWRHPDRKTAAWLALAEQDNRFKYIALHQAAYAQYQHGHNLEAGELFDRSFREAAEDRTLPVIDWSVQWTMTQSLGEAGWQLAWTRLRERVADSGDAELALRFLAAAQQIGRIDDAQRVIAGLDPANLDPELALALFDALVTYGRMGEAGIVLASLRERPQLRDSVPVVMRAAGFAEQQGRLDDAAVALEQALVGALAKDGMTLDELRQGFARLFDLRARLAQPIAAEPSERDAALERALAVADRWRVEDPDNQEIDRLCANLLWSLGRGDDAWRQLASTLDRHGAEGEALAWVADTLERGGDLERADVVWARAIAVEPTDPTHRLRRAQNLLASGDPQQPHPGDQRARALIDEVTNGTWQPRFAPVVEQARRLGVALDREP